MFMGLTLILSALVASGKTAQAQTAAQNCENLSGDQSIAACDLAIKQNPKDAPSFLIAGLKNITRVKSIRR